MERDERIEELETELRELKALVERLGESKVSNASLAEHPDTKSDPPRSLHFPGVDTGLVRDVRDRAGQFFRGDSEESIETRIGSVWLTRLAVFVTMTAVALGARFTFTTDDIGGFPVGPLEKTVIGYAVSLLFVTYAVITRWRLGARREFEAPGLDLFAQAILGCGLAGLYFTTYATFFVAEMQTASVGLTSLFPPLAALIFVLAIVHQQRSGTVAGISLFLAYYTVAMSAVEEYNTITLAYALLTCSTIAISTLVLQAIHRCFVFSWMAAFAAYLTYAWFFLWRNPGDLSGGMSLWFARPAVSPAALAPETWFWLAQGFLVLSYVAFSLTCILEARQAKNFRVHVAPMAAFNSVVVFVLLWLALREYHADYQWEMRAAFSVLLIVLALLSNLAGPRWNYLTQIHAASAVVVLTLAFQAAVPREGLLVVFAAEGFALAIAYRLSGVVLFKALGTALLFITFGLGLIGFRAPGEVSLFGATLRANWFNTLGCAAFFVLTAWFYDKFRRPAHAYDPDDRREWLFGSGRLDYKRATLAMIYASAAAILLLTVTIMESGDSPRVPFVLALQGMGLAVAGLILFTAQVEVASVLLIAAAHVCYHIFLWMPLPGFEQQTWFPALTLGLALFTYLAALGWERYLKRFHFPSHGLADLEHHFVVAVPYLAATVLAAFLLNEELASIYVPAAIGALALALLLVGSLTRYPGVRASGVLASAFAAVRYCMILFDGKSSAMENPLFPLYAGLFLASLVGMERLYLVLKRQEVDPSKSEDLLRTVLAMAMMLLGVLTLYVWSPRPVLGLSLLLFSVLVIVLGVVFREPRYRMGALVLLAGTVLVAFLQFQERSQTHNLLTFAAAAGVLLVVSWGYSRSIRRNRKSAKVESPPPNEKR